MNFKELGMSVQIKTIDQLSPGDLLVDNTGRAYVIDMVDPSDPRNPVMHNRIWVNANRLVSLGMANMTFNVLEHEDLGEAQPENSKRKTGGFLHKREKPPGDRPAPIKKNGETNGPRT